MKCRQWLTFPGLLLCGSLIADPGASRQPNARRSKESEPAKAADQSQPKAPAAPTPVTPEAETPSPTKIVQYGEKDVVRVKAKIRFTTLLVLPKNEQILDFTCGDKEFWIVSGAQNIAYVKPAKVGSQTNLNLITASGNIYSFVLAEVSEDPKAEPDLKVFVEPKEESMVSAGSGRPRFVAAREVEGYRQQVEIAKEETRRAQQSAQAAIDSGITKFLENVRFPYRFEAGKKPFNVRAMYSDDKFTYIQARPEEAPTLYEVKDGKPNLVNFSYKNGVYVVDKILEKGYLVIGKQKLAFSRQE